MPIINQPFEFIAMDLVGPLPRTENCHLLVIMDYATCWPEVIQLKNTSSKAIANEIAALFTRNGVPKKFLMIAVQTLSVNR